MKILVMTVGGEDRPLVDSIKENWPDRIEFICSGGENSSRVMVEKEGLVCKDRSGKPVRPNILVQSGYPKEKTTIREVDPDDPTDVYRVAKEIITGYKKHNVLADYTGGTKSMASGLLLAALEFDYCQPILMKGPRADLIKVTGDASSPTEINRYNIMVSRYLKAFEDMLARQDYGGAWEIIRKIYRFKDKANLEEREKRFLSQANLVMLAFDKWDRFRFGDAWNDLVYFHRTFKTMSPELEAYKDTAFKLEGLVQWLKNDEIDKKAGKRQKNESGKDGAIRYMVRNPKMEPPLPVYDLFRNAERRAKMEQYDDAVARLYRATELFAQFSLCRLGISTSSITEETLARLPEEQRQRLEHKRNDEGQLALGLFDSYELLSGLNEPIGRVWQTHKGKIKDVIRHRNMSWLAHGFEPVTKEAYEKFHWVLMAFIEHCEEEDPNYSKGEVKLKNYPDLPSAVCFAD